MISQLLFQIVFVVVLHRGLGTTNFALKKSANQSSTTDWGFLWTADKAVDGNINGWDADTSKTCSATAQSENGKNNNWEVDIGFPITMKTITVYGRTNGGNAAFDGLNLYFRNASGPSIIYSRGIESGLSNSSRYVYKPNDVTARIVSLTRFGIIMILCEVTVEGECLDGYFSDFCNATCGKCISEEPCNKTDGTCLRGCDKGWKGFFCKEGCEIGKYGYNCNETCGNCLNGNDSCSNLDGNCTDGCIAGWHDFQCNKECNAGSYGYKCNEACGYCLNGNTYCLKTSGRCTDGCQAGWKGETCKSECETGWFGFNCRETCGYCLNGSKNCIKTSGQCSDGCQAGWKGEKCTSECDTGLYGLNCSGTCGYCLNGNSSCLKTSGQCSGGCQAGWKDATCKSECIAGTYGINCGENCGYCLNGHNNCSKIDGLCPSGCVSGYIGEQCKQVILGTRPTDCVCPNVGVIVGSVLAAVGVTNFAIAISIVIVRRKRRKKENGETNLEDSTTAAHYVNMPADKPDAAHEVTFSSITKSANSVKQEGSLTSNALISMTNSHSSVMEPDMYKHGDYEQLRDATRSAESAYSTLKHNYINPVPTLQSLEEELRILDEKRKFILASKEILLRQDVLASGETKK